MTSTRWLASTSTAPTEPSATVTRLSQQELAQISARTQELASSVLDDESITQEDKVLDILEHYLSMASSLVAAKDGNVKETRPRPENTATSALLSNLNTPSTPSLSTRHVVDTLSNTAFSLLIHRPLFITPAILTRYVQLQSLLQRPASFPAIFQLYRSKPVPRPSKNTSVSYTSPNPDKPVAAVPPAVADVAIDCAIASRDLSLALDTIENTYCTTAYKRSKFLRSALFPLTGFLLTPPAAYTLATRFSDWQTTMDPSMATNIAMAGFLTYTAAVGTVGYVALTTANDQMVRVTWAMGVPLWERWVREEERGAIDKISQAWGFASKDKWGEEEGEEWEYLKEFCGLRGMMLDRVELMDGME